MRFVLLLVGLLTAPGGAPGERRIGVLFWHDSPADRLALAGVVEGIRVAGLPWRLLVRRARSNPEAARRHLEAFARERVDLVLTFGTEATRRGLRYLRGRGLPLVFTAVTDPVGAGIVPSWRGSGSFYAGNSNHIGADRLLDDFRRVLPELRVLGVLFTPGNPVSQGEIRDMRAVLERRASLGIRLRPRAVPPGTDPGAAARELLWEVDALWVPIDYGVYTRLGGVVAAARAARRPLLTTNPKAVPYAVAAVLPDYHTLGMQAVVLMRRILVEGVEPGSLPVGTLRSRFLVLNLAAARAVGLRLTPRALAGADRILTEAGR